VDYGIIEILMGIITIVGFMYKFEKDTREDVERSIGRLANVINSVGEAIVEYLGLRGILDPKDVRFLRTEVRRLTSTATLGSSMPVFRSMAVTEQETERIRLLELIDKDDLTIEETEELYRLARKFYEKYIDKTPDAFKVLLYAAAMRGITYRKYGKQPSQQPT
jgi:radical SAM superfamily enzyme YgiQ (UPF0313 family)